MLLIGLEKHLPQIARPCYDSGDLHDDFTPAMKAGSIKTVWSLRDLLEITI